VEENLEKLWKAALGQLQVVLSRPNFNTWFKDSGLISVQNNKATIGVKSIFVKNWIQSKFHKQVKEVLSSLLPGLLEVQYKIGEIKPQETEILGVKPQKHEVISKTEPKEEASTKPVKLDTKYTFETFVVGPNSRLAHAAALAVSEKPGETYNPLFIYGGVGLGKTHLMQAIGNEIIKKNLKASYISSEQFTSEFITAVQQGKREEFKKRFRTVDVLLIDDIQFLAGKEGTQEEFFHTFNALHQAGKQIVISSDRPPKSIEYLPERLISRLGWGLVADITPPDIETRVAILRSKCKEKNFAFPPAVLQRIAEIVKDNIRELESALTRLAAHCDLAGIQATPEMANEILSKILESNKSSITPQKLIRTVAQFYQIKSEDIIGKKRDVEIVKPRQVAMYLLREMFGFSYPKIAKTLGGKDHTTIMHGVSKIEREISDPILIEEIKTIKDRIHN